MLTKSSKKVCCHPPLLSLLICSIRPKEPFPPILDTKGDSVLHENTTSICSHSTFVEAIKLFTAVAQTLKDTPSKTVAQKTIPSVMDAVSDSGHPGILFHTLPE